MNHQHKQKHGKFGKGDKKERFKAKEERFKGKDKQFEKEKLEPYKKKAPKGNKTLECIENLQSQYEKIDMQKVKLFSDLPLSPSTLKGLEEAGFKEPTEIQRQSIGLSLKGLDILGAAKTGSGKTLAFILPILERLYCQRWSRQDGVGALVITPTRELAYQIFETLKKVGKHHDFSAGLVIGGKDLKFESGRLHDCNVVICTPGRLLQHLDENPAFTIDALQVLVLDEADRCLDLGFKEAMNAIIASLPSTRQTLLFSATQTRSVQDLARLSLESPVYVSVHENSDHVTPDSLTQSYIVTELKHKVDILWSFLKNHKKKKILVFMQSCKQVKYMYEIFCRMRPGLSVLALYGSLHQLRRMAIYEEFCSKSAAVLFATDIAARGLDFPAVDWVLQLDCPEDAVTYVHRAGRTARYSKSGESLLVLLESEECAMLKQLSAHKIPINKIEVNPVKLSSVQKKMAAYLASDKNLKESAQRAFQSYIKSIYLMRNKAVFDVTKLRTEEFAESLGLAVPPRVRFLEKQMKIKEAQKSKKKEKEVEEESVVDDASLDIEVKENVPAKKTSTITKFNDSDDDDDDILTVKRKDHTIAAGGESGEDDEEFNDVELDMKKIKVVTKAAVAKKILKKKIQANSRLEFDEEGATVSDGLTNKASEVGKDYEKQDSDRIGGGIDIEKAREVLKEEDVHDKKAERARVREKKLEQKRKEKEQRKKKREEKEEGKEGEQEEFEDDDSSDGESVDLSWLPDPDKVYGKKEEDEKEFFEDSDDEDKETEVKVGKRKITVINKVIPKKAKLEEDEDSSQVLDTGLSLEDDEDLALQLLSK